MTDLATTHDAALLLARTAGGGPLAAGRPALVTWAVIFAQVGLFMAVMTPATLTISLRLTQIDPANKAFNLAIVLGSGAFFLMVAAPIWGALSDGARLRWGRRRPFLIGGSFLGAITMSSMALTSDIAMMAVIWSIAQVVYKASLVALLACVGDFVPEKWHGRLSAAIGIALATAPFLGAATVQIVGQDPGPMFITPALVALVTTLPLALCIPDGPARHVAKRARGIKAMVGKFWIDPRKMPDFGWLLANRFFLYMANAFFMSYQAFFLIDRFHIPPAQTPGLVLLSTGYGALGVGITSLLAGYLSDRTGRRKVFVLLAGMIAAAGLIILGLSHSVPLFLAGAVMTGVGMGMYYATDIALAAAVLRKSDNLGKGMGLLGLSASLPQSVAPVIAPALLALGGASGYTLLFSVAASCAIFGSLLIVKVAGAR